MRIYDKNLIYVGAYVSFESVSTTYYKGEEIKELSRKFYTVINIDKGKFYLKNIRLIGSDKRPDDFYDTVCDNLLDHPSDEVYSSFESFKNAYPEICLELEMV